MITPAFNLTATERVLPKLALDFTTASLDPRVAFTRTGNTATVVNSSGIIAPINADLPRFDYNSVTLACKGLLIEEQRTNLLLNSDVAPWGFSNIYGDTITADAGDSPDGTTTADQIGPRINASSRLDRSISLTVGVQYSISYFHKYSGGGTTFPLSLQNLANATVNQNFTIVETYKDGWVRSVAKFTPTATNVTIRLYWIPFSSGTYLIWGAQLEAGAFATSYIPTGASAVTRNADVATMTGTNFSDWFNASQGTLCATGTTFNGQGTASYANALFAVTDNVNDFCCLNRYVSAASGTVRNGGVTQASFTVADGWLSGETHSAAIAYKDADFGYALDGVAEAPVASGSIPAGVDRAYIGRSFDGSDFRTWNGHVLELSYYPQRLTDAELAAITA